MAVFVLAHRPVSLVGFSLCENEPQMTPGPRDGKKGMHCSGITLNERKHDPIVFSSSKVLLTCGEPC